MSSLHQDRLLVEGPTPATGAPGTPLVSARGTARRPAASAEEKATTVPPQRQGTAQRSRTTRTAAARGTKAAAKPAAAKSPGTAKRAAAKTAPAKTAPAKPAPAKPATAKTATAKTATAKRAAAKPGTAGAATAKSSTAAKRATAAEAGVALPTTLEVPSARVDDVMPAIDLSPAADLSPAIDLSPAVEEVDATPAARPRPTPYRRTAASTETADPAQAPARPAAPEFREASSPAAADTDAVPHKTSEVEASEVVAAEVVAAVAEGRRPRWCRRRPPRRRPALYLAAALVGATSVGLFTTGGPSAHAETATQDSVSVARELGIKAQPVAVNPTDTNHLQVLAASRNERDAEQAAAAQAQADADRAAADAAAKAAAAAAEAARPKAVLPVNGARLTSTFGMRWGTLHAGIDLAAPIGTPEYAAMDGVVLKAGPASGFGLAVYIQHADGNVTVYGHMEKILVQEGQVVKAGDTIALLGNNGQSTGPHLHFEVHVGGINGEKIDPLPWLHDRGINP